MEIVNHSEQCFMGNMWINCNDGATQIYTCTMNIHLHHCTKVIKPCMFYHLPGYSSNSTSKFGTQIWREIWVNHKMVPEKKLMAKDLQKKMRSCLLPAMPPFFYSKYMLARTFSFCTRINFYSIMRILPRNSATLSGWCGIRITDRIHTWAVAR